MPSKSSATTPSSSSTSSERPEAKRQRRSQMQVTYRESLFEELMKLKYVRPEVLDWPPKKIEITEEDLEAFAQKVAFQYVAYEKLLETQDQVITNLRERLRIANSVKMDSEYIP